MTPLPGVSVIVPAYNAGKYLCQCAESVLAQSFDCWELIVADDGSDDGSMSLLPTDARIRVVEGSNGGPSAARNRGIDAARGEWLLFLDADDMLPPGALETLLQAAHETLAPVVAGKTVRFAKKPPVKQKGTGKKDVKILTGIEAARQALYQRGGTDASACGKLFSRKLFEGHRFREGMRYEDLMLTPFLLLEAGRVAEVEAAVYCYRLHAGSYLHTPSLLRRDALTAAATVAEGMERSCPRLVRAAREREMSASFNILLLFNRMKLRKAISSPREEATRREVMELCRETIRRHRLESLLDKQARLKSRLGALASYLFF